MNKPHKIALIWCLGFLAPLFATAHAHANSTSSCDINTQSPKCTNTCDLNDYFQYIFNSPGRPHDCRNIPPEFRVYQTQVGEVSSSSKSSGASASSSSSAASAAGGVSIGGITMTPTAQATAGAMIMRYAPGAAEGEGSKVIYEQMDADDNGLVPLEKAIWLKLLGTMGRKNATNDNASAKIESVGVMAGMDLFSNDYLRVGVLGSITDVSVEVNENDNKLDAIALKGGVTATAEIGKWYLDGLGTFSQERTKTSRTVDIDGLGDLRPMWSKYTNRRINAAFETGFRFTAGRVVIQPLAGVSANWLKQQRVLEQGNADAAVLTDKNTTMTGTTKLGMNLSTVIIGDHITVVPTIGGYWGHRFGELSNASRISTDLGTSYEYVGAKPPLDVFNLHASVMVNLGQRVAMSANYHAAFNHIERNHSGNVGLRVRF